MSCSLKEPRNFNHVQGFKMTTYKTNELTGDLGGVMSNQLNINPEMDKLAREHGLEHWSCVSPKSNQMWVRSDGCGYYYDGCKTWIEELKEFDVLCEIGKNWQIKVAKND